MSGGGITETHVCEQATEIMHECEDGVKVQLLPEHNGVRTFFFNNEVICKFPGYEITKYAVVIDSQKQDYEEIIKSTGKNGKFILSNDGPLLLIFKVLGKIRIHLMRVMNHTFYEQFNREFEAQYGGYKFQDLFSEDETTASVCHLFRQGSRSTAVDCVSDASGRSFVYSGSIECSQASDGDPHKKLSPPKLTLTVNETSLNEIPSSLVCYRYAGGEIQILRADYLRRVAIMTGRTMESLITGGVEMTSSKIPTEEFSEVPASLKTNRWVKLHNSRFPRMVDLFSLFVLAGLNPNKKNITVLGFKPRYDEKSRIIAEPKCGFYNFCRVAGVHPRSQLKFPATPVSIRLAVRRLVVESALGEAKKTELEEVFSEIEDILYNLTPMFVLRVLKADYIMQNAFRVAFGIDVKELLDSSNLRISDPPTLRSVKSALLLANQYNVLSLARFSEKYLADAEFTPLGMRYKDLLDSIDEYSRKKRRD